MKHILLIIGALILFVGLVINKLRKGNFDDEDLLEEDTKSEQDIFEEESAREFVNKFNVDDIIHHMNGVDPAIIQNELSQHTGQYKTIKEIIEIMKGE